MRRGLIILGLTVWGMASNLLAGGGPQDVVVVINENSLNSQMVGRYYAKARGIQASHLCYVNSPTNPSISQAAFENRIRQPVLQHIEEQGLSGRIRFIVFSADFPYKIRLFPNDDAYSLTAAMYYGCKSYSTGSCNVDPVASNSYFGSESAFSGQLNNHTNGFISSLIEGWTTSQITNLINRSVRADYSNPTGTFYFVETSDALRSARRVLYKEAIFLSRFAAPQVGEQIYIGNTLAGRTQVVGISMGCVMAYCFTNNTYVNGALGDHLTSFGGDYHNMYDLQQARVLDWMGAGCVASYGTVIEPCARTEKFPDPRISFWYQEGFTAGESYWMSVSHPYQGLFTGDPLCQPFAKPATIRVEGIESNSVVSGIVSISANVEAFPGRRIGQVDLFVDDRFHSTLFCAAPQPGEEAACTLGGTSYAYTVQSGDTLAGIVSNLAAHIHATGVKASARGSRLQLEALDNRQPGSACPYSIDIHSVFSPSYLYSTSDGSCFRDLESDIQAYPYPSTNRLPARGMAFFQLGVPQVTVQTNLDTRLLADGPHHFRLVAYEGSALRSQSDALIPLKVDNLPYAFSLNGVTNGQTVIRGQPVSVQASVDDEAAAFLTLLVAGREWAYTPGSSLETDIATHLFADEEISIQALAQHADGRQSLSETVTLRLRPDTVDSDTDGMMDGWELRYAFNVHDPSDATLDADADGVNNLVEHQLATNPRETDSDGDHIPDAWELDHGLSPLDPSDGYCWNVAFDQETILSCTNVTEYDAHPNCFELLDSGRTLHLWSNSWKRIEENYEIHPDTLVKYRFKSNGAIPEITGIGHIQSPNAWTVYFLQNYGTQPAGRNTYATYEGCNWRPFHVWPGQHICRYGIPELFEGAYFACDADAPLATSVFYSDVLIGRDRDFDGLPNYQEYLSGTDPNDPDTDNDLFPDGYEGLFQTSPLDQGSAPIANYLTNGAFESGAGWQPALPLEMEHARASLTQDIPYDGNSCLQLELMQPTVFTNIRQTIAQLDSSLSYVLDFHLRTFSFQGTAGLTCRLLNMQGDAVKYAPLAVATNSLTYWKRFCGSLSATADFHMAEIQLYAQSSLSVTGNVWWDGVGLFADVDMDRVPDHWELTHQMNPLFTFDAARDYDLDKLTNYFEYMAGSDPYQSDTDGDLLNDLNEFTNGTDACRGDTDRDRLNDRYEYLCNSDPRDANSQPAMNLLANPSFEYADPPNCDIWRMWGTEVFGFYPSNDWGYMKLQRENTNAFHENYCMHLTLRNQPGDHQFYHVLQKSRNVVPMTCYLATFRIKSHQLTGQAGMLLGVLDNVEQFINTGSQPNPMFVGSLTTGTIPWTLQKSSVYAPYETANMYVMLWQDDTNIVTGDVWWDDLGIWLDYDADLMPDIWEVEHALDPMNPNDAGQDQDADGLQNVLEFDQGGDPGEADTDHDGVNDGAEVFAGTALTDNHDVFRVYEAATNPSSDQLILCWPSITGRLYTVMCSLDLTDGWTPLLDFYGRAGTGEEMSYTTRTDNTKANYSILISPP
jgi:uncharacterized protein (TIGR03790 family)